MPSTERQEPSSSPPKKKTAIAELFGDVFKKHEQVVRPLAKIIEDEVASYRSVDSIDVDADPFMWWKTNESKFLVREFSPLQGTRSRLAADSVDRLIFLQKNFTIAEEEIAHANVGKLILHFTS